eukprot:UN01914
MSSLYHILQQAHHATSLIVIIAIGIIVTFSIPIYLLLSKCRNNKPNKVLLSSNENNDNSDDIASDVITELELSHPPTPTKPHIRTDESTQEFEKIKSLEQALSEQKLLNRLSKVRLQKKEKACAELQTFEQNAQKRIRELIEENRSISNKNSQVMKYCKNNADGCREEYDESQKKLFIATEKNSILEKENLALQQTLSEHIEFKSQCATLKLDIEGYKTDNNKLQNVTETQKHRLHETLQDLNNVRDELALYKEENKRIKADILNSKDKINELELDNRELIENQEIKKQIQTFSEQLQQQSVIRKEIIGIRQQLTCDDGICLAAKGDSDDVKIQ